jgi:hypothetical protein
MCQVEEHRESLCANRILEMTAERADSIFEVLTRDARRGFQLVSR